MTDLECPGVRISHTTRAFLGRPGSSRKVFVVGTGRSGTTWLGRTLDSHPECSATIESPLIFGLVVRQATGQSKGPWEMAALLMQYRLAHARVAPLNYVDKSHPNVWLVEDLNRAFPGSAFIGIQRDPFGTVASMLEHRGVRRWVEDWERYPIPNRFLGVYASNESWYRQLSIAGRCAQRWLVHADRLEALKSGFPQSFLVIQYRDFSLHPTEATQRLQDFLGLSASFTAPDVRADSRERWRDVLSQQDLVDIESVTGASPPAPIVLED